MKKRSFTQLKNTMTITQFNKFSKKLAEEYANSSEDYARTYYSEKYDISMKCFYKVLEYAIILNLVSDITVQKMLCKSIRNQTKRAKGAGAKTKDHYNRMYKKRLEYMIFSFSDIQIKKIAQYFANNFDVTKADLAKKYNVNINVIDVLLKKAITEKLIDDETFDKIKQRSLRKDSSDFTIKFFKLLDDRRNDLNKGTTLR